MAKYDVAAYIWPAYTGDEPRNELLAGGHRRMAVVKMR